MSMGSLLDVIVRETDTRLEHEHYTEQKRPYQVLTEVELIELIVNRNPRHSSRTLQIAGNYSDSAFVLHTAAHNQLIHEEIPSGSYVMIDPRAEAGESNIVAYALPDQNAIALGIRDTSWDGYFISFGARALHITSKRCVPLWPAKSVVGFDL